MDPFLSVVLFALVLFACYLGLKRVPKTFWFKLFFPILYYLYKSRLGYVFHLQLLKKERAVPHSISQPTILSPGVKIVPIAILEDNYSYLIIDTVTNNSVVVDPADPGAVKKCIIEEKANLKAILTTHKHWDHAGGNEILKKHYPGLQVYGGFKENVAGGTHSVQDKETIKIGNLTCEALWTPGHTLGHMVYILQTQPLSLFTGDHIFVCGNGQMFEGDAEMMLKSIDLVKTLPGNSLIFPGHEYAFNNVKYASHLLPIHTPTQLKWKWVTQQRNKRLSTVPSILSEEMNYNPFMSTHTDYVKDALSLPHHTPPAKVLAELRKQKNAYEKAVT